MKKVETYWKPKRKVWFQKNDDKSLGKKRIMKVQDYPDYFPELTKARIQKREREDAEAEIKAAQEAVDKKIKRR